LSLKRKVSLIEYEDYNVVSFDRLSANDRERI
jgi:hypothetical protein